MLEKSGTWLSYKGERLGQGRENARVFLKENADIRGKIEHDLRKALGLVLSNSDHDESKKPAAEAEKPSAMAAAAAAKARPSR